MEFPKKNKTILENEEKGGEPLNLELEKKNYLKINPEGKEQTSL